VIFHYWLPLCSAIGEIAKAIGIKVSVIVRDDSDIASTVYNMTAAIFTIKQRLINDDRNREANSLC
jgi:hypothetical protein